MEEDFREQKIEALEVLSEYNEKLVNGLYMLVTELKEKRKEYTDKFQKSIIDGINWEIEILNRTLTLINDKEELICKEDVNKQILELGEALKGKEDKVIASVLEQNIIPQFNQIGEVIKTFLQNIKN